MAAITHEIAEFHDPAQGGDGYVGIVYDSVTLLITTLTYQNTTARNASVTWNGHTTLLLAGTPTTSTDISARGEHVTITTDAKGRQIVFLPGGSADVSWPA